MVRAVLFDLDGTLIDSAPHISSIINDMLAERGSPRRVETTEARQFLTRGGHELVTALLAGDGGDAAVDVADFRARYAERQTPADCLFPGVRDGLVRLREQGLRLAICSNKPQSLCERIVADLGMGRLFDAVVGSGPGLALKPAPAIAERALSLVATPPVDCLYVGDSEVDRRTAEAVGLPYVFVTYGYAEPDVTVACDASFDTFDTVVGFILDRCL